MNMNISNLVKSGVALLGAVAVAYASGEVINRCDELADRYLGTETVKKHFWSKPVTVRKFDGKVVK